MFAGTVPLIICTVVALVPLVVIHEIADTLTLTVNGEKKYANGFVFKVPNAEDDVPLYKNN